MNPTTQCILVTLSLVILALAILQPPSKPSKEPFVAEIEQVGIGVGAGIAFLLLIIGVFFFYYNTPNEPTYVRRRFTYYNME